MADGGWDEDAHPRGPDGRFGGGSGPPGTKAWAEARAPQKAARDTPEQKMTAAKEGLSKKLSESSGTLANIGVDRHVEIAKDVQAKHASEFQHALSEIKAMAPADAKVKGRVKDVDSIVGKLERKSDKYVTAKSLQDTTGIRVVCKDLNGVKSTIAKLESSGLKVVEKDDYIDKPKEGSGYRSAHFIVESKSGLQKEIQIRTEDQNKHAEWAHDAYKPQNSEQRSYLSKNAGAISKYSSAVSDHFHAKAEGKTGTQMPRPPKGLEKAFGIIRE